MPNRKIKVLYLVLEMDLGGLQRLVNLFIQRVDRSRFEPYLCCLDRGGIFYEQARQTAANTFVLCRRPGPFDPKLFLNLYKLLRDYKIDIIHSHNGCTFYAALAGRLAGVKGIIHTDHGRLVPDRPSAIWEDWLSSFLMNQVIGVSETLTEYLARRVKIPRKKLATVINGVDIDKFQPRSCVERMLIRNELGLTEKDRVLGTVCRLDPIKNLEFLIRSIPLICEAVPDGKLLIVGDGPSKDELCNLVKRLGLETKVLLLGRRSAVERLLPSFDVYVCTSLSEGTSMTILEAMACGLPVVASAVGGNGTLVDSSNGFLFPLNDSQKFVRSALALLTDSEIAWKMGANSRRIAEARFRVDQTIEQYEQLYETYGSA